MRVFWFVFSLISVLVGIAAELLGQRNDAMFFILCGFGAGIRSDLAEIKEKP